MICRELNKFRQRRKITTSACDKLNSKWWNSRKYCNKSWTFFPNKHSNSYNIPQTIIYMMDLLRVWECCTATKRLQNGSLMRNVFMFSVTCKANWWMNVSREFQCIRCTMKTWLIWKSCHTKLCAAQSVLVARNKNSEKWWADKKLYAITSDNIMDKNGFRLRRRNTWCIMCALCCFVWSEQFADIRS